MQSEFKHVTPGIELAKTIAGLVGPSPRNDLNFFELTDAINDMLHGRNQLKGGIEGLKAWMLEATEGTHQEALAQVCIHEIAAFQERYSGLKEFVYSKTSNFSPQLTKNIFGKEIVTQAAYDNALREGFPKWFFIGKQFENIIFSSLPENTDFGGSFFVDCKFYTCALRAVDFQKCDFYACHFASADMCRANFGEANFAHSRFNDCDLSCTTFREASMRGGLFSDCTMNDVSMRNAKINGTNFIRIETYGINDLNIANTTMGGATPAEVNKYQMQLLEILKIVPEKDVGYRLQAAKEKHKRPAQTKKAERDPGR